jgi:hypothetical protein
LDEVDADRWRAALAQLDCARDLLEVIGVKASAGESDLSLELTPRSGRLFLDALQAVYDTEVQRLTNAEGDHIYLPLRSIPALRNFIVDTERRLGRTTKGLEPLLDPNEKRKPRTVRFGG